MVRKIIGWIIVVIFGLMLSFIELFAAAAYAYSFTHETDSDIVVEEIKSDLPDFLLIAGVCMLFIFLGWIMLREKRKSIKIVYDKPLNISFTGTVAFKDYRNFVLGSTFLRWPFAVVLAIFAFSWLTDGFVFPATHARDPFPTPLIFLIVAIIVFIRIFFQVRKNFNTHKILNVSHRYTLTNEALHVQGATLDTTLRWDHFSWYRETGNFFLFYHGRNVATFLDKKMFTPSDLEEFQMFVLSLPIPRK